MRQPHQTTISRCARLCNDKRMLHVRFPRPVRHQHTRGHELCALLRVIRVGAATVAQESGETTAVWRIPRQRYPTRDQRPTWHLAASSSRTWGPSAVSSMNSEYVVVASLGLLSSRSTSQSCAHRISEAQNGVPRHEWHWSVL